jgi:hypothetical protein
MKVKHCQVINNLYKELHFGEEFRYGIKYQDSSSDSITFNLRNFWSGTVIPCDKQSKTTAQVLTCYCKVSAIGLKCYDSPQAYYRHRTPGKWYIAIPIHYITKCDKSSFNLPVIECPMIINYSFQTLSLHHQLQRHHCTDRHKCSQVQAQSVVYFWNHKKTQKQINKKEKYTRGGYRPRSTLSTARDCN